MADLKSKSRIFLLAAFANATALASGAIGTLDSGLADCAGPVEARAGGAPSAFDPRLAIEKDVDQLQQEMQKILARDPLLDDLDNEARYYQLMVAYLQVIPRYATVDELIENKIVYVDSARLRGHYILSQTHLGVLQPLRQKDGSFIIASNRGTHYFRGPKDLAFGSNDAAQHIRSAEARSLLPQLLVNLAIPVSEALRFGYDLSFSELRIRIEDLPKMRGLRLFQTPLLYRDLAIYERGLRQKTTQAKIPQP